uniref:Uncharacterized protein n=1 Tax=Lygus hesperus TaxID=30085 RepID=A0A146MCC6_LYGHE
MSMYCELLSVASMHSRYSCFALMGCSSVSLCSTSTYMRVCCECVEVVYEYNPCTLPFLHCLTPNTAAVEVNKAHCSHIYVTMKNNTTTNIKDNSNSHVEDVVHLVVFVVVASCTILAPPEHL